MSDSYNMIASGTNIEGNLTIDKDIRIEGKIKGDIKSNAKIIIGENGLIEGNISCQNIDIFGKVTGNISATETVALGASAEVSGNLVLSVLSIEPNAKFFGNCEMLTKE